MNDIKKKAYSIVQNKILPTLEGKTMKEVSIELDVENVYPLILTFSNNEQLKLNVRNKDMAMEILGILSTELKGSSK